MELRIGDKILSYSGYEGIIVHVPYLNKMKDTVQVQWTRLTDVTTYGVETIKRHIEIRGGIYYKPKIKNQ